MTDEVARRSPPAAGRKVDSGSPAAWLQEYLWFDYGLPGTALPVNKFLGIYLKDQLAVGVLLRELARRAEHHNRHTPLGEAVSRVAAGIAEDVDTLQGVMRRVGVRPNQIKNTLAVGVERLGRLKFNGRIAGLSPLSRFVELEFLAMGIDGKKLLWTTLRDLGGLGPRLPDVDFDELMVRAERQRAELEPVRTLAGTEAFASSMSTDDIEVLLE